MLRSIVCVALVAACTSTWAKGELLPGSSDPFSAPPAPTLPSDVRPGIEPPEPDADGNRTAAYRRATPARYPPSAVMERLQGKVLVRIQVDPEGRVIQADVMESSGHPALDEAALAAVRDWTFHPELVEGRAVETWVAAPIVFKLHEAPPAQGE